MYIILVFDLRSFGQVESWKALLNSVTQYQLRQKWPVWLLENTVALRARSGLPNDRRLHC